MNIWSAIILMNIFIICVRSSVLSKRISKLRIDRSTGALNCILNYYETYTNTNGTHPGSIININIVSNTDTDFLNLFLKSFGNHQRDFFHSTLIIQTNARNQSTSSLIVPKTKKYILFALFSRNIEKHILSWKSTLSWNPLAPVFVLLRPFAKIEQAIVEVKRTYKVLHKYEMLYAYVALALQADEMMKIYGWFPYQTEICAESSENFKMLEQCSYNSNKIAALTKNIVDKRIEWNKLWSFRNLNQCPLKISANIYAPYVMINNDTQKLFFSGAEVNLVKIIASKLNMTLQIQPNLHDRYSNVTNGISDIEKPIYNG